MAADDVKKLILARRARFVATALAGVTVACGKDPAPPPQPCLSVPMEHDASTTEPPPQPCLSPMPIDAGAPAVEPPDVDAGGATTTRMQDKQDAGAPKPCLAPPLPSASNHPIPMPCLSVVKPPDKTRK